MALGAMLIFDFASRMKHEGSNWIYGILIAAGIGLEIVAMFLFFRGPRVNRSGRSG